MALGPQSVLRWIAALLLVATSRSQAQAPSEPHATGLHVDFSGPEICGPPDRLSTRARALLADSSIPAVHVDADVARTNRGEYTLRLRLSGAVTGERELQAKNCDEAIEAGAVVVAWAIDPEAVTRARAAQPAPEPEAPTSGPERAEPEASPASSNPEPEPSSFDAVDALPSRTIDVRAFVGGTARIGSGLANAVNLGPEIVLGLEFDGVRLSGHGYSLLTEEHSAPTAGAVDVDNRGLGLRLCGRLLHEAELGLHLCGGGQLAFVAASAAELRNSVEQHAHLFSIVADGLFTWRVAPPLRLALSAGLQMPTTRPRFTATTPEGEALVLFEPTTGWLGALGAEFEL